MWLDMEQVAPPWGEGVNKEAWLEFWSKDWNWINCTASGDKSPRSAFDMEVRDRNVVKLRSLTSGLVPNRSQDSSSSSPSGSPRAASVAGSRFT